MIGASKILTVSYGTFSCTLEGFDDPFNTMRAIAEYFRDLAAEDRYFGAEPPTPDAAMLHKIAEREVQRRVEARVQDNGVILRAADADDRMPEAPVIEAPVISAPTATADLDTVMDAPAVTAEIAPSVNQMPDGVAARLAKIRAAVALSAPEVVAPAAALSDFTEDQHADEAFAPFDNVADAEIEGTVEADSFAEDDIADVPAMPEDHDDLLADLAALDGVAPDAVTAEVAVSDAADDAMLANLSALAVQDVVPVADLPLADHGDDDRLVLAGIMGDDAVDDTASAVAESLPQDVLIDDDVADDDWAAADDMPAEVLIGDDLDDWPEELTEVAAEAPEPLDTVADDVPADDIAVETAAIEAPVETAMEPQAVETAAVEPAVVDAPAILEKAQRARARVIRVRRHADIAIDRPAAAPETAPEANAVNVAAAPLADDAEAELQRELAALEAEADTAQAAVTDADDDLRRQLSGMMDGATDAPVRVNGMPAGELAHPARVEEDAVRRLMDQTSSEMAVPENRRRLSSIAHLKAAVAATIAERFGAKPKAVEEVEATRAEPYRNDLARTVRPVRPTGTDGKSERPAPLVLVSEQRIDRPTAPAQMTPSVAPAVVPVRPRRITANTAAAMQPAFDDDFDADTDMDADTDTDNIFGDAKGFAEFADRVGAHGLSELLEAAAAYGAAVEGRDSFTRPQLLRQIAGVSGDTVTREDELRSFGALLRDGRIVKVKRGQFALTETSPLLAEARKIAG